MSEKKIGGLLPVTRRDVLQRLLGGGIGFGLAATASTGGEGVEPLVTASSSAGGAQGASKGPIIRTVLKDVAPESLGPILFHEHLEHSTLIFRWEQTVWYKNLPAPAPHFTENFDVMVTELKAAAKDGVGCIVDATHADTGRTIQYL